MEYEDFLNLCETRRSVRKYNEKKVLKDDIYKVISAGIQAPSPTNTQGWKFKIIDSHDQIKLTSKIIEQKVKELADNLEEDFILKENVIKYSKNFSFFKNAPVIIFIYCKNPRQFLKRFFQKRLDLYKGEGIFLSLGMVIQNMMLAAHSLGLSTCILTGPLIAENELNREFEKPKKHELGAILALGYSDIKQTSPGRKSIEKFLVD